MPGVRHFCCPRCQWREFTLKSLFRHLHVAHGSECNWTCGLSGCMRSFPRFPSYRKHVFHKHSELLQGEASNTPTDLEDAHNQSSTQSDLSVPHGAGTSSDVIAEDSLGISESEEDATTEEPDYLRQLAMLLLKWKEGKRLPETTLNEIAGDVICYIQGIADRVSESGQQVELLSRIRDQIEVLTTHNGRDDYWRSHLPFVEPVSITLGTNEHGKRCIFHYVPICEVLKKLLDVPEVYSSFWYSETEDGYLSTPFDGTAFQQHSFFKGDRKKICVQLYADEFEVCDPLGSKRGKHKLLGVYFSVLNVPQRSTLSQIHLVLLVKDKDASAYGLQKVFQPLMQDILKLEEEGIVVNGEIHKGTIFVVTGDNLSSHRIGGFKCSFSGGRICRFCLALRNEISHKHLESDFVIRSPEGHLHHLQMLKNGIPTLSLYGVRESCPLSTSGFQPTEHFPPDVMHDVLEGVIPFVMKHIIGHLISNKFFSLDHLNQRIVTYGYGMCDSKNKPEKLSQEFLKGKGSMKGSASQILCFFRHFTLYVGDSIPSGNSAWELYLLLREIVDLVMSRKLPTHYVPYLHRLIHFFCIDFQNLFPQTAVPCKLHFLVHYPSLTYKYGPLVNLWAMRFEGKHQYFKDMARKLHSFKNVTRTLAYRHQYLQAYILSEAFKTDSLSVAGSRPVVPEHVAEVVRSYIELRSTEVPNISILNSVKLGGMLFVPGAPLLYRVNGDDLPDFIQVCNIYSINKEIIFEVRELLTVEFDRHYHVYVVCLTDNCFVVTDISGLKTDVLCLAQKGDKYIVSARSALL
ncbi:uncharacterized protein LOC135388428 [Ornithodoros turicata]|uniref:uncharacterized protein LOC135388428 n=1 Tax=Ornithodoros turicata TaxID=34597 RepID=UPI0031396326